MEKREAGTRRGDVPDAAAARLHRATRDPVPGWLDVAGTRYRPLTREEQRVYDTETGKAFGVLIADGGRAPGAWQRYAQKQRTLRARLGIEYVNGRMMKRSETT